MVSEQLLYVLSGLACLLKISGPEYEILFLTFSPLHWYFWLSVLLHMSILTLVPCCLIIVASFEIRSVNSPTFFFFKIALFIQGPLQLNMNFRIIVSIFAKKKGHSHCDRDGIDHFGEYCHLHGARSSKPWV